MNTTIIAYFQKNDSSQKVEEFTSLGGEPGMCLVKIDDEEKFFICWTWKDGSYTRPSTQRKGMTIFSQDTDYLAIGAKTYASKQSAKKAIVRCLEA